MYRIILLVLMTMALAVEAAPKGGDLYQEYCSACHQGEGKGGIGAPLTTDSLEGVSDQFLNKTIRLGRPGRIMPSFSQLSDSQVDAIVVHLRQMTDTQQATFDQAEIVGNVHQGSKIYQQKCAICHGFDGNGFDGSGAAHGTGISTSRDVAESVKPTAISNSGFQQSVSDALLKYLIRSKHRGLAIPTYSIKQLQAQDLDNLISFVRTLGEKQQSKDIEKVQGNEVEPLSKERISHLLESSDDFETTVTNLEQALTGANFRMFPRRYLEQGLFDEFSVNKRQVTVRFCNFKELDKMLKLEPRLGVLLPCSITIMERPDGKVLLAVPNLSLISKWFNNDQLVHVWKQMEDSFNDVIEEVTL